ncbi:hypothetical protein I7I51_03777 [Histoplasma capsulatum]|uniref:Uncharacterized protein n=1 Tax=Ajellomyces capsulatus TaxID=5037 RepID=A0A8A1M8M1_AJECA|nr:hypothetical protein I7I51_03777 [Histoplasma capsulatum]
MRAGPEKGWLGTRVEFQTLLDIIRTRCVIRRLCLYTVACAQRAVTIRGFTEPTVQYIILLGTMRGRSQICLTKLRSKRVSKYCEAQSAQCRNDPGRQEEPADSYHSCCWREMRRWGMRRRRNDRGKEKSRTRKKERDVIVDNVVGEGGCARCGVVLVEWSCPWSGPGGVVEVGGPVPTAHWRVYSLWFELKKLEPARPAIHPQIARFLGCSHWAATTEGSQPSEQGVAQGGGRLRRV